MRLIIYILLLFVNTGAFAQGPDVKGLGHSVADLDKALIGKDSVALKWVLSDDVSYGHSNGWVETKREMISDLFNGKLSYNRIVPSKPEIVTNGSVASVRMVADIDVMMEGKPMSFKLKVLQVWVWDNEHWRLFARQSVKA